MDGNSLWIKCSPKSLFCSLFKYICVLILCHKTHSQVNSLKVNVTLAVCSNKRTYFLSCSTQAGHICARKTLLLPYRYAINECLSKVLSGLKEVQKGDPRPQT